MKKSLVALSVWAVVLTASSTTYAGWVFAEGYYWESYNGKYYALTETGNGATWEEVRQEALALGGDLVVIDDAAENTWLADTMFTSPNYQNLPGYDAIDHLWIGLYQDPQGVEPAGGWAWVDGSAVGYSNWGIGEPSDGNPLSSGEHIEDWGALRADATNSWNDYSPTAWLPAYDGIQGIMELDELPSAPAPGAVLLAAIGSACVSFLRRRSAL